MKRVGAVFNKIRNYISKNKVIKIRISITWWDILITIFLIVFFYECSFKIEKVGIDSGLDRIPNAIMNIPMP